MITQTFRDGYPVALAYGPIRDAIERGHSDLLVRAAVCSNETLDFYFDQGRFSLTREQDGTTTLTVTGFELANLSFFASELHDGWEELRGIMSEVAFG